VSETVELRQRGRDYWGCCPFHHEKSPSFHVMHQQGLFKCFGCGEGGDVFSYVMKREGLEFQDSVRYLADRAGIELHEERGQQTLLVKPRLDTRDGDHMVASRIGLSYPCIYFDELK
jgi:DNA primase